MAITLKTYPLPAGNTELTYKHSNGVEVKVGEILVELQHKPNRGGCTFRFNRAHNLGEPHTPLFRTRLMAAQYDALAWAEENVVTLIEHAEAVAKAEGR